MKTISIRSFYGRTAQLLTRQQIILQLFSRMKSLFVFSVILLAVQNVSAQDTTSFILRARAASEVKSNDSWKAESKVRKDIFGNTVIEDRSGNKVGVIRKDISGNLIREDASGRTQEVYKTDIFGNRIVEDGNGNRKAKIRKNIFGDDVEEDASGNVVKVYKKDILGNIIVQDGDGRQIGIYRKDILGNMNYQAY